MSAGYSGTPLPRKLGIRAGHRVALFGAPDHVEALLDPLPEDVVLEREPEGGGRDYDVALLFERHTAALERRFASAAGRVRVEGGLWVAWPKKSSPLAADLAREAVRRVGLEAGLVDVKVCAIDADWSGLRFVVRRQDR
ncbi:MAG: DUF3052 family protein [Gemmatimonadetes bacterium]|nr:MAG: DUF3052 family protein [Gemmatimonadota bacterium]